MLSRINATLTPAQKTSALASLDTFRESLPFLVDLSVNERRHMPHVNENALPFILKCLEVGIQHPDILRGSFDLPALQSDVALAQALLPVQVAVRRLWDEMEDTFALTLIEAYVASLKIYAAVQDAEGLDDEKRDLSETFHHKKTPPSSPPEEATT